MVAGVSRDGWTHSPTPGRRAARHRGQQVRGPDSPHPPNPGAEAAGEPRWLCPELRFQFHDVTVQTCGLQAPAAAARPVRPPLPPARQARAPQPPAHPGRLRRSPGPEPREPLGSRGPGPLRGVDSSSRPRALRRTYSARPGRRRRRPQPCCSRERASERASKPGREGGADGRRGGLAAVAVPCRAAPCRRGPGPPRLPHAGPRCALEARPPPASSARRASLPPPRAAPRRPAPRELATRAAPPPPRASEEPLPPPVRPRDRARAAALRLGARLARLTPALIFRKS